MAISNSTKDVILSNKKLALRLTFEYVYMQLKPNKLLFHR